jgi:hypothetical protein
VEGEKLPGKEGDGSIKVQDDAQLGTVVHQWSWVPLSSGPHQLKKKYNVKMNNNKKQTNKNHQLTSKDHVTKHYLVTMNHREARKHQVTKNYPVTKNHQETRKHQVTKIYPIPKKHQVTQNHQIVEKHQPNVCI